MCVHREEGKQVVDLPVDLRARHATQGGDQLQVFAPAQVGIEVGLFRNVRQTLSIANQVFPYVFPTEKNFTARGLQQTCEHFHSGAFSRSVWAEASEYLARRKLEGQILNRREARIAFSEGPCFQHGIPLSRVVAY